MTFLIVIACLILGITGLVSGIIMTAEKWNWLTYYSTYRKKWMPEKCLFCLSFWLGALFTVVFVGLLIPASPLHWIIYLVVIPFSVASFSVNLL